MVEYLSGNRIQGKYNEEYKVHKFTSSGNFVVTGSGNVDVLVVAGGGGGYSGNSDAGQGGGGAGGMSEKSDHSVTAQTYSIVVGTGGAGGSGSQSAGSNGNDSSFDSIISDGGGRGEGYGSSADIDGGSGGGGGGGSSASSSTQGNTNGATGYGNAGGTGSTNWAGGGGGGAGTAGSSTTDNGSGANGANGGDGRASTITGSSVIYSAGGGGGGGSSGSGGTGGSSGIGGNGTGNAGTPSAGATNTGSGGGSGRTSVGGGAGATGIVIIRYKNSSNISATGGTTSTAEDLVDEKTTLTNVPINTRYEETDKRKIYRRAVPSSPEATKNYVYGTSQVPAGANATVSIGDSGTKMYLTSNSASDSQKGYQYTLSTAYDVSTASYASKSYQFGSQSGDTRGMKWKNNGIYCYKMSDQTGNKAIYRYTASTAWDISTLGSNQSYTYSSVQTGGKDMDLSSDGLKMYALADNATIYQYTLSTAWQVSSGVSSASKSHSCQSQDNAPRNFQITNSGTKLRYLGSQHNKLYTYTLSTAWDISTASYDGSDSDIDCNTFTDNPYGVWCKDDFSWLAIGSVDSPYDVQQFDKDPVWKERGTA